MPYGHRKQRLLLTGTWGGVLKDAQESKLCKARQAKSWACNSAAAASVHSGFRDSGHVDVDPGYLQPSVKFYCNKLCGLPLVDQECSLLGVVEGREMV